jgi:hypothetical protein
MSRSRKNKEGQISFEKNENLKDRSTLVYKGVFPSNKGYYCKRAIINFDEEKYLPVKIAIYGWEDELLEEYLYEELKFNVGLTDKIFDINNPKYGF